MVSGVYDIPIVLTSTFPITPTTNILANDIEISEDILRPGNAANLRFYFGFIGATSPFEITVSHLDAFAKPTKLNADNNFDILSNGLYRFDIPVNVGDKINFRPSVNIANAAAVLVLRAHLGTVGA